MEYLITLEEIMMRYKLLMIITALTMVACTSEMDAKRALKSAGYDNIKTGGYGWFSCSESDFYSTKFTATNPSGRRVEGVVCSGLFLKNATIRF